MMTGKRTGVIFAGVLFPILLFGLSPQGFAMKPGNIPPAVLSQEINRHLATLNYYDVFDHLTFRIVAPGTVDLAGQVTRAGLKADAEAAIRRIKGVDNVVDQVEVLPQSAVDDAIRWAAFRAIFDKPALQKYATQSTDPLRIIVKNREITLDGEVASQFDKGLIDMSARSVTEATGVTDHLIVGH